MPESPERPTIYLVDIHDPSAEVIEATSPQRLLVGGLIVPCEYVARWMGRTCVNLLEEDLAALRLLDIPLEVVAPPPTAFDADAWKFIVLRPLVEHTGLPYTPVPTVDDAPLSSLNDSG